MNIEIVLVGLKVYHRLVRPTKGNNAACGYQPKGYANRFIPANRFDAEQKGYTACSRCYKESK